MRDIHRRRPNRRRRRLYDATPPPTTAPTRLLLSLLVLSRAPALCVAGRVWRMGRREAAAEKDGDAAVAVPGGTGETAEGTPDDDGTVGDGAPGPAAPEEYPTVEDERTLLDVFGDKAKVFLTERMIPETDPGCRFDPAAGTCAPYCLCVLRPLFGDYHVDRS
eukprot:CAMPEP_0194282828 /NCGR_PEP_ID=MMETSP0169-20130528/23964_1 /TAXON_ID=218684 /ORGANISM="Corethron pennatum, Strain L29A3" /LENGTH=162 /DNA_ID=CAMNT_0039028261 /DNA_START=62 /DNA_END=547 /DNA_ORIENTATION=+